MSRRGPVLLLVALVAAALLHDTGKIAIPEHILNKPGKLTPAEYEKMKLHAPIGAEILSAIDFPYPVVPIVRHHHENWDGTGYPDGLSRDAIPLAARIITACDAYSAMTSDRPYRAARSPAEAVAELRRCAGRQFDGQVVELLCAVLALPGMALLFAVAPWREPTAAGTPAAAASTPGRGAR